MQNRQILLQISFLRQNHEYAQAAVMSESLSMLASPSLWDFIVIFFLRPVLAIAFVLFLISLGWLLAWKLVLFHVPLVQEIFGLRQKPAQSKPPTGRLSKIYSNMNAQNLASGW